MTEEDIKFVMKQYGFQDMDHCQTVADIRSDGCKWQIAALLAEVDRLRKAEELLHSIMGNQCVSLDHEERYKEMY